MGLTHEPHWYCFSFVWILSWLCPLREKHYSQYAHLVWFGMNPSMFYYMDPKNASLWYHIMGLHLRRAQICQSRVEVSFMMIASWWYQLGRNSFHNVHIGMVCLSLFRMIYFMTGHVTFWRNTSHNMHIGMVWNESFNYFYYGPKERFSLISQVGFIQEGHIIMSIKSSAERSCMDDCFKIHWENLFSQCAYWYGFSTEDSSFCDTMHEWLAKGWIRTDKD